MKIEMAPAVTLENLEDLYFELVPDCINLRNNRPTYLSKENQKTSQLLSIDLIKTALGFVDKNKLKSIYLIGSEPIFNPDFNKILRYCIKFAPTIIVTGGQNINEKKARFLAKVQDENDNNYPIDFRIKFYHFDERINDTYCTRGDFRKVVHAIESLQKYNFYPTIIVENVTNEQNDVLIDGFTKVFGHYNVDMPKLIIKNKKENDIDFSRLNFVSLSKKLHCAKSRVYSSRGVFSCPNLVGDNRARLGMDLKNFSKRNYLETDICKNCVCQELNI